MCHQKRPSTAGCLPAVHASKIMLLGSPRISKPRRDIVNRQMKFTRALVTPGRFPQNRQQLDRPTVHGRMLYLDAPLSHHLVQITHTQPLGDIPAHAHQHHIKRIVKAFKYTRKTGVKALHRSHYSFSSCIHTALPHCVKALSRGAAAPRWQRALAMAVRTSVVSPAATVKRLGARWSSPN